jgi:hypothetical protein
MLYHFMSHISRCCRTLDFRFPFIRCAYRSVYRLPYALCQYFSWNSLGLIDIIRIYIYFYMLYMFSIHSCAYRSVYRTHCSSIFLGIH